MGFFSRFKKDKGSGTSGSTQGSTSGTSGNTNNLAGIPTDPAQSAAFGGPSRPLMGTALATAMAATTPAATPTYLVNPPSSGSDSSSSIAGIPTDPAQSAAFGGPLRPLGDPNVAVLNPNPNSDTSITDEFLFNFGQTPEDQAMFAEQAAASAVDLNPPDDSSSAPEPAAPPPTFYGLTQADVDALTELGLDLSSFGPGATAGTSGLSSARQDLQTQDERIATGMRMIDDAFRPLEGYEAANPLAQLGYQNYLGELGGLGFQEYQGQLEGAGGGTGGSNDIAIGGFESLDALRGGLADLYQDQAVWEQTGTPLWEKQRQAYLGFVNPQIDAQARQQGQSLTAALSRSGLGRSSYAVDQYGDYNQTLGSARQDAANRGEGIAGDVRSQIEQQRGSLTQLLQETGDPSQALAQLEQSRQSIEDNQGGWQSIGPLFQNLTAGYGAYQQGQQNMQNQQLFNDTVYGRDPLRGSGRVIQ
jgi:hypothetical protein